jgi:hypothetical protein
MTVLRSVAVVLALASAVAVHSRAQGGTAPAPLQSKLDRFLDGHLPVGFYIYTHWRPREVPNGMEGC